MLKYPNAFERLGPINLSNVHVIDRTADGEHTREEVVDGLLVTVEEKAERGFGAFSSHNGIALREMPGHKFCGRAVGDVILRPQLSFLVFAQLGRNASMASPATIGTSNDLYELANGKLGHLHLTQVRRPICLLSIVFSFFVTTTLHDPLWPKRC